MISLDLDLPAAALADGPADDLAGAVRACGGTWLRGRTEAFLRDDSAAVVAWRSATGDLSAQPTDPSRGNVRIAESGADSGLVLSPGVHGGMVIPELPLGGSFSMAVIWYPQPSEPARTLLTVNPAGAGADYLFLSHAEDGLTVKHTGDAANLVVPEARRADGAAARMVIVTAAPSGISLWQDGATQVSAPATMDDLPDRAALFIGCRSHRKGLQKTLGAALVRDVVFLPRRQILSGPPGPEMTALLRYFRWSC